MFLSLRRKLWQPKFLSASAEKLKKAKKNQDFEWLVSAVPALKFMSSIFAKANWSKSALNRGLKLSTSRIKKARKQAAINDLEDHSL